MENRERTVKIAAIMTAPRYECTWARNQIDLALKGANIPLTVSGGVFYGQCMQIMMESLIADGGEFVVTVDFDSIFTTNQLQRLIHVVLANDHIDAVTGMQVKRGHKRLLGTIPGGEVIGENYRRIEWDGNPIQATTAHFGLTVIDLAKLATVPKPWFRATPDANGTWTGNDKIDEDVSFWMKWKDAGYTIYMDPSVRIGHMEEMITIHDAKMEPQHVYPSEWESVANAS